MKLLINNKEIANYLIDFLPEEILYKDINLDNPFEGENLVKEFCTSGNPRQIRDWLFARRLGQYSKFETKIQTRLTKFVEKKLKAKVNEVLNIKNSRRRKIFYHINDNLDDIIHMFGGEKRLLDMYKRSRKKNFVKSTGLKIDKNATLIRRQTFNNFKEDCLIRNTVGNENLLVSKLDNNYPMWFIDSGYTNFLRDTKKWHRIIRNHLHYGNLLDCPVDRMECFEKYPKKWRKDGEKILLIEPGPFAASVFHIDLNTWADDVRKELAQYTDKPVVVRPKAPKEQRTPLFEHLLEEDYYCVVSLNSNSCTEAIWAGIPCITLGRHITNPVTRNKLSDINDLYRGNLAQWLATVSYSQFTQDELMNGKAMNIVRKYHG